MAAEQAGRTEAGGSQAEAKAITCDPFIVIITELVTLDNRVAWEYSSLLLASAGPADHWDSAKQMSIRTTEENVGVESWLIHATGRLLLIGCPYASVQGVIDLAPSSPSDTATAANFVCWYTPMAAT